MTQEEFVKGIKGAIAEILERSTNKWVSVLEPGASFGAILAKNGISPKVTPPLFKVLSSVGIIQREGIKSTIRYRYVPTSVTIPDLDKLAAQVWLENQAYNRTKNTASKQKRVTPPRDINQNGKAKRTQGNIVPSIGDSRYMLMDCDLEGHENVAIVEVKIVSIQREVSSGRYFFDVVFRLDGDDNLQCLDQIPLARLFVSPEAVVQRLFNERIKFHGELFPTIKGETVKQNGR